MPSAPRKTRIDLGPKPRSLEARVYAAYDSLTPTEKRLADVFLQYQMELASYTAGELADKATVSRATAARLIRVLGYRSYPEAKRLIRAEQNWGSPRANLPDPDRMPTDQPSLAKTVQVDLENIRATTAAIPEQSLKDIAQAIAAARRLWIMGLRSGHGLAHHAAHYFTLLKGDVQVLPTGTGSYSHEIGSMAEGDVLLVIAFRRRPQLLPTILQEARGAGALTILITDLSASASARAADHVLRCRTHSASPFNSFVAAVTLLNHLAWAVAAVMGEASVARFRRIDRLVQLLDNVSTPQSSERASPRRR